MKYCVYKVNGVEWKLLAMIRNCSYQVLLQKIEFDDFTCLMAYSVPSPGPSDLIDKENAFLYNAVNLQNLLPSDLI